MALPEVTSQNQFNSASISGTDLLKASFAVTVNGATEFMDDKFRNSNHFDSNYSLLSKEADTIFNEFNVPVGDRIKYTSSNNYDHLRASLEKNKFYNESTAKLNQELPVAQYPLMMATSLFDPVDWVTAPIAWKALGSIKAISDATRFNNILKAGVTSGISATASEALLQDSHNVDEGLATTAVLSSLLGGGLGALLPVIKNAPNVEAQGKMLDELSAGGVTDEAKIQDYILSQNGVSDFNHIKEGFKGKIEGWKKNFVWSPGMLLFKSKNPSARAVSYHSDKGSLALSNNGELVPNNSSTAMETKQDFYGHYVTNVMKPLVEEFNNYKVNGGTKKGKEWLEDLGKEYRTYLGKINDDAWSKLDEMDLDSRKALYKNIMGDDFEFDEGIVDLPGTTTKGKPRYSYRGINMQLQFDNLMDKVIYQATAKTPNPNASKYLRSIGMDNETIEFYGDKIRGILHDRGSLMERLVREGKATKDDLIADTQIPDLSNINYKDFVSEIIPDDFEHTLISKLTKDVQGTYDLSNPMLKKIQDFYDYNQRAGEALNMKALKGRNGKAYLNRVFSKEKIEELGEARAIQIMKNALLNSNATKRTITQLQQDGISPEAIHKELDKVATASIKNIQTATVYNEMNFKDVASITTGTSFFKPRQLDIDERMAFDILDNDIGFLTNYYSYKTSPKLALKKHLNIETESDIDELLRTVEAEGRALGMTTKELAKDAGNIKLLIDTINGTRGMANDPNSFADTFVRRATKFNYVTLGGGFGLNTLAEIGTGVMTHGVNFFKQMNPAFKEAVNMYKKNPTTDVTNDLLGLGLAESIYRSNKVQRYDDLDFFSSTGKFEDLLDRGSNIMSDVSGLNFLTTFLELTSHSTAVNDLVKLADKVETGTLTRAEQKRLARLGLTNEDLIEFKRTNRIEFTEDGYLLDYNYSQWGNQELVGKIRNGVREMVKNAVIQADPTSLPAIGTSGHPMAKLFTQFLRFPMAAHERIMLKGIDEANANMVVGSLVSAGMMTMIFSLREEAMIQSGFIDERDRKYDLDTEEGVLNMAQSLSTKMPFLGSAQPIADIMLRYSGMAPDYGRDTISSLSPTLGRIEGLSDVLKDIQDGNLNNRSATFLKYITPFNTLPVINDVGNAIVKD